MKSIFPPLICLLFLTFSSCSRDDIESPSSGASDKFFNWTISAVTTSGVSKISQGDADNVFIAGTSSYRISRGVQTKINFGDSTFTAYDVSALDSSYAVFAGSTTASLSPIIKIYDNGSIQTYTVPGTTNKITGLYVTERGKFFAGSYYQRNVFKFDFGAFSLLTIPAPGNAYLFGRINSTLYAVTSDAINSARVIYRIDGGTLTAVRTEANSGNIFYAGSDFIKVESNGTAHKFFSFAETGWSDVCIYYAGSNNEYVSYVTGSSRNFFTALILTSGGYNAHVFGGGALTKQANFPSGVSGSTNPDDQQISLYNNNAFHFCYGNGTKILKGVYAQ